jgi:hypothetical protein
MSHIQIGCQEGIDSRLLVVGSQTASLTPGPSFATHWLPPSMQVVKMLLNNLALIEGPSIEVFNDACLLMMTHWTFGHG